MKIYNFYDFYGNRAFQEPWELPELRYRELVFKTS